MFAKLIFIAASLAIAAGCAPAERVSNPANWPDEWDGRSLWATPHAYIYAADGGAAGEMDRLAERVKAAYSDQVGQPTPPVLIIARKAGEPLPGGDYRALLRSTLRAAIEQELEGSPDGAAAGENAQTLEEKVEEELTALWVGALAMGSSLEVLAGMMPLTCDARSLREICKAPDGLFDEQRGAVILPTRDCLRTHARRTMQAALNQYGIGPVAQVIFAPVLVVAEAETVDGLDRLRDAALFNYWLFEYADLPLERKREIASAELERWGGTIEAAAAEVTRTADDLAATAPGQESSTQTTGNSGP